MGKDFVEFYGEQLAPYLDERAAIRTMPMLRYFGFKLELERVKEGHVKVEEYSIDWINEELADYLDYMTHDDLMKEQFLKMIQEALIVTRVPLSPRLT